MTNQTVADLHQWVVSARSRGEALATTSRAPGVELVMVGVPSGYSAEEVESWLRDLVGMAIETSAAESGARPIPALLHHLLTGLIFSHSELWERSQSVSPTSLAFVRTPTEVAFGWVNGPPPDLWIDDHRAEVEWVRIRDHDGREALALSIDPTHRIRLRFALAPAVGHPDGSVSVDAAWVPDASAAAGASGARSAADPAPAEEPRTISTIARAVGARASVPGPASEAAAVDGWRVVYEADAPEGEVPADAVPTAQAPPSRSWWSGIKGLFSRGRAKADDSGYEDPLPLPPAEEIEPAAAHPAAERMPEEPEFAGAGVAPYATVDLDPALPERIPPSPEPAELTARAAPVPGVTHSSPKAGGIELAPLMPEDPASSLVWEVSEHREISIEGLERTESNFGARLESITRPAAAPPAPAAPEVPSAPAVAAVAAPGPPLSPPAPSPPPAAPEAGPNPFMQPEVEGPPRRPRRVPMHPDWSEGPPRERPFTLGSASGSVWSKPWAWGILVVLLFIGGWWLGSLQTDHAPGEPSGMSRALRALGLGGARFDATITSDPPGAWIAIDGKDLARRTPATVDLVPGTHQVALSFSDHGSATFELRGARGDKVPFAAQLMGSLAVYSGDGAIPVAVSVDGTAQGLAPVRVEKLTPGTHEVRFSGPGLQPWGQTVQIRVLETTQIVARAVSSPATGLLEVHAMWSDAEGSEELTGADVYVDGEKRGVSPLSLELPRGPHSVRVESRGENSPVQVIDLPGGNQRFANFELGLGLEHPSLTVLGSPIRVPLDQPTVLSAALQGGRASETREMWLHVKQPDGEWRRYPMVMMKAPGGIVGSAVLPNTFLDDQGRMPFYVSATNQTGDDFFSEILFAQESKSR